MEEISPFIEDWKNFGFIGPPRLAKDYSWIRVQDKITFIGLKNVISDCTLFFSSLEPHFFMVLTSDDLNEMWDISDLKFSIASHDSSVISSEINDRRIHISGVTPTLIELLIKIDKLDNIEQKSQVLIPLPVKIKTSGTISTVSKEEIKKSLEDDQTATSSKVTVTGTNISLDLQGIIDFKTNSEIVVRQNDETNWSLPFDTIVKIESTKIHRIFVIIYTNNKNRYEIGFDESNS